MSRSGLFLDLHVCAGRSEDEASSHASVLGRGSGKRLVGADGRAVSRTRDAWRSKGGLCGQLRVPVAEAQKLSAAAELVERKAGGVIRNS